jgi:hypothetical protein
MTHHEAPLPDYDSLPTGSIESRSHALDPDGVRQLLDYERQHANRPQVGARAGVRCRRARRLTGEAGTARQPALARRPDEPGPTADLRRSAAEAARGDLRSGCGARTRHGSTQAGLDLGVPHQEGPLVELLAAQPAGDLVVALAGVA